LADVHFRGGRSLVDLRALDWRFGLTSTEEPEVTVLAASAREYRVTVATDAVAALEELTRRACFEI